MHVLMSCIACTGEVSIVHYTAIIINNIFCGTDDFCLASIYSHKLLSIMHTCNQLSITHTHIVHVQDYHLKNANRSKSPDKSYWSTSTKHTCIVFTSTNMHVCMQGSLPLKTHLVPVMDNGPLAAQMNIADVGKHKLDGLILIGGHCQRFQTHKV